MRRSSQASGAERPAFDRRFDPRQGPGVRSGSISEVEATCRRIAEYLLDVSRDEQLEPALHEFMRVFHQGRSKLDPEARERSEKVYEAVFQHEFVTRERSRMRDRCDPHFWG